MKYRDFKKELIKEFNKKYIRSLFIAGSVQEEFTVGSDIDIFIIVHEKYLDDFFNMLTRKMNLFINKHKEFTYTYFRGPIKYEKKILLHFVIYTNAIGALKVQDFQNEPPQVFQGILRKYDVLVGADPKLIEPEMNLTTSTREQRENYMKRKADEFWKKGSVTYRAWKKKGPHWVFESTTIKLSPWQKTHLAEYFTKYALGKKQ